jgi:DNA polymerase-3 subunit delta'
MTDKLSDLLKIEKSLISDFKNNKLHHGLLFLGNQGIGKYNLALNIVSNILTHNQTDIQADLKKIITGCHPDLLIIKKENKKQSIAVDAIRDLSQFLSLTSAISKYRAIIIDSIDDLNKNSSNAILKILEEPPVNVFLFLINHNPHKILDTIKSRCRLIKISNPDYENFKNILQEKIKEVSDNEIKVLAKISNNSVGLAIKMYNYNALELREQINQLILENNNKAIFDLSRKVSSKDELWEIFERLIIFYLYNLIYPSNNYSKNSSKVFIIIDKVNNLFSTTKNLNLDKSQSAINIFNIIKNARK